MNTNLVDADLDLVDTEGVVQIASGDRVDAADILFGEVFPFSSFVWRDDVLPVLIARLLKWFERFDA